jgi:hypothetical protein
MQRRETLPPRCCSRRSPKVHPGTSSRIAWRTQHEADGSEFDESESATLEVLPVLDQSAITVQPSDLRSTIERLGGGTNPGRGGHGKRGRHRPRPARGGEATAPPLNSRRRATRSPTSVPPRRGIMGGCAMCGAADPITEALGANACIMPAQAVHDFRRDLFEDCRHSKLDGWRYLEVASIRMAPVACPARSRRSMAGCASSRSISRLVTMSSTAFLTFAAYTENDG